MLSPTALTALRASIRQSPHCKLPKCDCFLRSWTSDFSAVAGISPRAYLAGHKSGKAVDCGTPGQTQHASAAEPPALWAAARRADDVTAEIRADRRRVLRAAPRPRASPISSAEARRLPASGYS